MTPTLDSEGRHISERVTVIYHAPTIPQSMLVEILTPLMAHVTDNGIHGGDHLGAVVTDAYCSICHHNGGDGSGECRHKDALYAAEAAMVSEAEAEQLCEVVIDPASPLVY